MPPGPIRSNDSKKANKSESRNNANQERAYIAASRRRDRSIEARLESARRASEIHQERTGKRFKITEKIVIGEEMYEEEDPKYDLMRQLAKNNTWPGNSPFGYQSSQIQNPMNSLHIFPFQPSTPMDNTRSRLQIQTQLSPQTGLEPLSPLYATSPTASAVMSPTSLTSLSPVALHSPQIHSEAMSQLQAIRRMSEASIDGISQQQGWDMNYFNFEPNQVMIPQHLQAIQAEMNAREKESPLKQQEQAVNLPAEDVSGTYFGFHLPSEQQGEKFQEAFNPDNGSNFTGQMPLDPDTQLRIDDSIPESKSDLQSPEMISQLARLDQISQSQDDHSELYSPIPLRNGPNQFSFSEASYSFGQFDPSSVNLGADSRAFDEFCIVPKNSS